MRCGWEVVNRTEEMRGGRGGRGDRTDERMGKEEERREEESIRYKI